MFNFMKYRYFYFLFSALFIVPGLISLAVFGLKPAIDFTGGSLLEVQLTQNQKNITLNQKSVQGFVNGIYDVSVVQPSGKDQYLLRGTPITNEQKNQVLEKLKQEVGEVKEMRFETVGPTLGGELLHKTILAGVAVAIIIIIYIWSQFQNLKFGVAAVLSMLHDGLLLIGIFSILGKVMNVEVDVLFVTALLTVLSFSVHDTIIVFDRIREMSRKHPRVPFKELVNGAILQTLGRSINNSMTLIIMLTTLVLLGGETIRWFAVALLIGAVTGTYSSTFVAAPILVVWDDVAVWWKKRKSIVKIQTK
jgi:preprotein translocase subunit SecF